jgi:PAS domain S-box-containing protein
MDAVFRVAPLEYNDLTSKTEGSRAGIIMGALPKSEAVPRPTSVEDRLRLVIDAIPCLILRAAPDGALDFINQRWLEFTGLKLEEVQGWGWRAALHSEDAVRVMRAWRAGLAAGEPFEHEARIRRVDDEYRWFLMRNVPLRDEFGNIIQWYGTGHDIEDLKQAEDRLQLVIDTTPALLHSARPDGDIDFFNKRMLDYLGVPLEELYGWRWTNLIHPDDVEQIVDKWRSSLATGEPFESEARVRRADGAYCWQLHRKVPLRDQTGNIIKWFGSSIEIDDRKRAEEKVRMSEFYLAEGQRLAHMGSWALNPAGFFSHWSRELFRIYGLDPAGEAPSLEEYLACVHPQDREFMRSLIERMLAEASGCDVTKRIVRPNGELRYIRCVGIPVVENGALKRIIGTAIDVTEHELLTQELRRREAYLAEAQRLSQTGSFGWKPDSGEIVWSDETYRIFEYDHTVKPTIELLVQRIHPEDRPDFLRVIESASAGATHFEHTYRWLLPDGSVKHVHALAHALQDASGNREFVGAATDVSSIKRAEEELRKSEAYLAEAQRLSQTGSWAWSPATDTTYYSEECYRLLGFEPHGPPPPLETVIQRIHPDDQAYCRERVEKGVRDKVDFELGYRIIHPDKRVRDIHCVCHPVLDRSGSLIELIGTVIDITERKRAEEELRRSEAEFRQILDLAPQLVGVFGTDLERLYANRMALDYFGVRLDEWRQTSRGSQTHPDDSERVKACWDRALASGAAYEVELRLRKHDGSYRWFLALYNPVRDDKGQIMRWYVASTDIDDRKQAEEKLQQENVALREEIDKASMFEEIIGSSEKLRRVLAHVAKVAPTDSTVLITGETGTGKELVARAIHKRSNRAMRPFVSVNCAAIPSSLVASELFGYEKGAFTGATQRRLGRFEVADGGTIFLDEIGELPSETQVALLRVLQERSFERVGGSHPITVNVRVVAATNRDLHAAVEAGAFRQDLFYRLNVFPLNVPPLRDRVDDIPILVEYLTERYARKAGKKIETIKKQTLELFQAYDWPGNVRELQNVVERAVILCDGDTLVVDETWLQHETPAPNVATRGLGRRDMNREKEMIEAALTECRGRVSGQDGAAAKLGIPRSTLESKIRSLKINKHRFKSL